MSVICKAFIKNSFGQPKILLLELLLDPEVKLLELLEDTDDELETKLLLLVLEPLELLDVPIPLLLLLAARKLLSHGGGQHFSCSCLAITF